MTTETSGYRDGAINGGLTTGIIGTSLGALGLLGGSLLGCANRRDRDYDHYRDRDYDHYHNSEFYRDNVYCHNVPKFVTKDEHIADMKIAARDSEIALLKAERDDEKKMVEVYTSLATQINGVKEKIAENRDRADDRLACAVEKLNNKIDFNKNFQDGVNAQQLAYNGTNGATIACMQNQIAQLRGMAKLVIPNTSVCPGWGPVTITPTVLSA